MSKRKICIFCETWESGGIESFLTNVLLRLDMQFFSVDVVAAVLKTSVFTSRLEKCGVQFWELSGNTRNVSRNIKLFHRLMEQQKYDVMHLNIYQALSMCYAAEAKKAGIPVRIIHSHNTALRKSAGRSLKLMIHIMAKQCMVENGTRFLACSSDAAQFMFPQKITDNGAFFVVPNGIETERFRFDWQKRERFREQWGLQGKLVVGNIGRLCCQKNQNFLLDVFRELCSFRPESKLLLVGSGDDEQMLRNKAAQLGIEENVLFYGTTASPEEALWAMDAFAFPSLFEGLGIVAIEAQAAGLPVFCSEAIPKEAYVTEQIHQVSLGKGAEVWAKQISTCKPMQDRAEAVLKVRQAGFDIEDVVRQIVGYYLEGKNSV